ncbi:Leucine-rich repeat [Sesbania bispinosa]|nr:Leucine-rich repeat [Sesbania bispinosa]
MKIEAAVPLLLVMPFYWLCLCNHIFVVSGGFCRDDQWPLLLQFKNNLTFDAEYSIKLKYWNESIACCDWSGVTCDNEGRVIGLDLSEESIYGGLFDNSSSLFSLQHLHKLNLAYNEFNSVIPPSGFSKLEKLTYLNLSNAGFGGQIPTEISHLTRLVTLDLSRNSYYNIITDNEEELKLENPNLRKLVQNLTSIRQLYLDDVSITAEGQEWINALLPLRDLQELSLPDCGLSGPLDSSLTRLKNLSLIILGGNDFSSPVPETFANFKNLTTLSLTWSELTGTFPHEIFQIGTLSFIDIAGNYNLHVLFPDFPLNGSLQTIRVRYTNFSGALPHSIGNLRHLSQLDLHHCQLNGKIPNSVSNLTALSYMDLSHNNLIGPMPSFGMPNKLIHLHLSHNALSGTFPSSSHFQGLHNLDLSHNSFSGSIPSSLFTLPLLQQIDLSHNQFSQVDESVNVSSSVLQTLNLNSNNLSGPFPKFIFHLHALNNLDLSSNKFHGLVQLNKLLKLRNLTRLDLSYNNLSFDENVRDVDSFSFPNIGTLNLASFNLKTFPGFLRNLSTLSSLDLSYNLIQGIVPNWIWRLEYLSSLNISNNFLTNLEGPFQNLTSNLRFLDLHNNQLQGPIPVIAPNVVYLDYSWNNFNHVIPQDIVLDLSSNNFFGAIPSCLITMTEGEIFGLGVLNLRKNNLRGTIPNMFRGSCGLKTVNLGGNLLDGPIPKSLSNCSMLEVLDIGNNQIIGDFPCFLKNISTLRVLVLRSNKFQGPIGCSEANKPWKLLQIVDIAFNSFSGKLPGKYFKTWNKMMHVEDQVVSDYIQMDGLVNDTYYQDSTTVTNKGQQMDLVKILTVFIVFDFSSNHFEGLIPREIMDFKALHVLNLSNNAFYGEIPPSIGNLKQLESLDLSHNSLSGEIPVQLASLTFLSYLDLSFNHLVGKIPTGTQLQSFPASSFEGNDGLYGPPLDDERPDTKNQGWSPQEACKGLACSIDWNFISAEVGFVSGLGIVIGPLLFLKQWRRTNAHSFKVVALAIGVW